MTGKKAEQSTVYNHSGFPGGLKRTSYADVLATRPERIIEKAIKGMLPHNTLGRQMLSKLKVYAGPDAPPPGPGPRALRAEAGLPVTVLSGAPADLIQTVGRRKEAIVRVRLVPGTGSTS
jgi:hypothetical protein